VRSDWDPEHGKKPDLQKRYPNITDAEYRTLLSLLASAIEAEEEALPQTRLHRAKAEYLGNLFDKIDARVGGN
jgi:hypothetical protein